MATMRAAFIAEPGPSARKAEAETTKAPCSLDPVLRLDAPEPWRRSVRAIADLEQQVTTAKGVEGVVLRYGNLYGPSTAYARDGAVADLVRARRYPIAGTGAGVYSFVHLDDAVAATVAALGGRPGIYNVVDDEPAPLREWLPAYAEVLAAPPRRVPVWLARLMAGRYGVHLMTEQRGASNTRPSRPSAGHPAMRPGGPDSGPRWHRQTRRLASQALSGRREARRAMASPRGSSGGDVTRAWYRKGGTDATSNEQTEVVVRR